MKLLKYVLVILLIVAFTMPTMALAKEDLLDVEITNMVEKVDKNGNPYIRFIAQMSRETKGHQYDVGVPIMAFGGAVEKGRSYTVGDQLKCIAKYREFGSSESYTIIAYID